MEGTRRSDILEVREAQKDEDTLANDVTGKGRAEKVVICKLS